MLREVVEVQVLRKVVEWRCAKGGGGSGNVLREGVGVEVC